MDFLDLARYLGALILVLALVGLAGVGARRFGIPGLAKSVATRRLAVVETLMVGPRHRLYLLRRDNVEHLVFAGPEGASVVEQSIPAVAVIAPEPATGDRFTVPQS
jgi:flagellar protein FliO/FliZ